jgi:hypothetical protein
MRPPVLAEAAHAPTLQGMGDPPGLHGGWHRVSDRSRRLAYDQFGLT